MNLVLGLIITVTAAFTYACGYHEGKRDRG